MWISQWLAINFGAYHQNSFLLQSSRRQSLQRHFVQYCWSHLGWETMKEEKKTLNFNFIHLELISVALPRFSAELLISLGRGHWLLFRPRWLPPPPLVGFKLLPAGECRDWLLCLRMVGNRATNDALCLKLDDALLISDFEIPLL